MEILSPSYIYIIMKSIDGLLASMESMNEPSCTVCVLSIVYHPQTEDNRYSSVLPNCASQEMDVHCSIFLHSMIIIIKPKINRIKNCEFNYKIYYSYRTHV